MTEKEGSRSLRTLRQLEESKLIHTDDKHSLDKVASRYTIAITPTIVERIIKDDPDDALRLQFVPTADELHITAGESADPIGDDPFTPVKGIVHRYPDRVLLKPLLTCAVYCRFCFRREQVGQHDGTLSKQHLDQAFAYIEGNSNIWEVILTGGDPFILSARRLANILDRLEAIDHVKTIRVHTRVPVVDPARITEEYCAILDRKTPVWVVVHTNASEELGAEAEEALRRLNRFGVPLLSQSVLLKGVNDTPQKLEALLKALVRNRVKPYYLHQGDLAQGTGHFRTTIEEGQQLMKALRGTTSGICQPTYTLDIPGGAGKVPIGPTYIGSSGSGWAVEDPFGGMHDYLSESN